ncbi:hypothetical protein MED222_05960 [Vibrio sp. MED222]|nr:hypothetical protein MED222_05960 [Vibrio sp. MED222]
MLGNLTDVFKGSRATNINIRQHI